MVDLNVRSASNLLPLSTTSLAGLASLTVRDVLCAHVQAPQAEVWGMTMVSSAI
jgi:hypothetical protein